MTLILRLDTLAMIGALLHPFLEDGLAAQASKQNLAACVSVSPLMLER
jgi:hypothetical protein